MKIVKTSCVVMIGVAAAALLGGYYFFGRPPEEIPSLITEVSPSSSQGPGASGATGTSQNASRYVTYSQAAFDAAKGKKRVYFFRASWCPTCKAAHEEFSGNPDGIPDDVVLFQVDYDSSATLKQKYGVTYQHTFVQVDDEGNEVAKWNGGGLADLATRVK